MSATVYSAGIWGMQAEVGLYVESIDIDFSMETEYFADEQGCDIGGAVFNDSGTFTLVGMTRTDEVLDAKLGASLVLQNAINKADFLREPPAGDLSYLITGRKQGAKNKGWQTADISGDVKPFLLPVAV